MRDGPAELSQRPVWTEPLDGAAPLPDMHLPQCTSFVGYMATSSEVMQQDPGHSFEFGFPI